MKNETEKSGSSPEGQAGLRERLDSGSVNEKLDELEAIYAVCLRAGMSDKSTALDYISSVFYAFQRLTKKRESWAVTVESDGESVVTLSSRDMSGREFLDGDADTIRTAAQHLLGFLGAAALTPQADARTTTEHSDEEMVPHAFSSRTPYEPGDDRDIWCMACEYHRDHAIHSLPAASPRPIDVKGETHK